MRCLVVAPILEAETLTLPLTRPKEAEERMELADINLPLADLPPPARGGPIGVPLLATRYER